MKVNKKLLLGLLGSTALGLLAVSYRGGGGGGINGGSKEPPTEYQGTYKGAVKQGDYAEFTVNGTTLTYKVQGVIFGNEEGTLNLVPFTAGANNHYWYSTKDGSDIYIFLAKNLGLAYIKNINGQGNNTVVVGIRNIGDVTNIVGKKFVYVGLPNNLGTGQVYKCEIQLSGNSGDENGTFTYECYNGEKGSGCWKIDNINNLLIAKEDVTCETWGGSNPDYRIIAKPVTNGRASIIVDYVDGTGVGIGLEEKPYTIDEVNNLLVYTWDVEDDCPAQAEVYNCNATTMACEYYYKEYGSEDCNYEDKGIIYLNTYCEANGTKITVNGVFCRYSNNEKEFYNGFFDLEGGYYVATKPSSSAYFEIGAVEKNTQ